MKHLTTFQIIFAFVASPFILLGMLAGFIWNAVQVGYWFADSLFDP